MELITTHTHTCFTNHGEGTVEELVSAAVCAGVSTIAVTEHYPMTDAFDPRHYLAMPADRMDAYLAAIEEARAAHPVLDQMLVMREELRQLWLNTSLSREQLTGQLQAWCQRAEASGIALATAVGPYDAGDSVVEFKQYFICK